MKCTSQTYEENDIIVIVLYDLSFWAKTGEMDKFTVWWQFVSGNTYMVMVNIIKYI